MTNVAANSILDRNLAALKVSSPQVAAQIRGIAARADVEFAATDDGVLTAAVGAPGAARQLASRRRPLEEARRLVETVDVHGAAAIVALGFGLGYHVRAVLERLARTGAVYVYEPDVALLRAVLERVDHSAWLVSPNITFITGATEAEIAEATRGTAALMAMGVRFMEHPADRARLGESSRSFSERFTSVFRAVRTEVVTTLMQSEVTVRNLLMNLDRYATAPGIIDLEGAARGRPAIVVSAGPSLRRNIDLLARPGVRDRFVIIAVQTVLKTLLARGIRPHFVTALDYHEISRRFYEGLTRSDVEGVTLIAMPWANAAILDAFPGAIRIVQDWMPGSTNATMDDLLGPGLAREHGRLIPGSTVAHQAYHVARHLGCDPVILIGQDLGFTDGQYYAAGAAIHNVWSGELNPFNSLEMMEWQRIVRARQRLHRATDVLGRPIYTDEQMATYRVEFQRAFALDRARGLRVIDATEGGVAKEGAEAMTLGAALAALSTAPELSLPRAHGIVDAAARLERVRARVSNVTADVRRVAELSRSALALLEEMRDHHSDQRRVNGLIGRVQSVQAEVSRLEPAYGLVQRINQTGMFKRVKADRSIALDAGLPALERQARQIERDIVNVTWIADAADQLAGLLDQAGAALAGGPKLTGEVAGMADPSDGRVAAESPREKRVVALIPVDAARGGLGTVRDLGEPFVRGINPLALTLRRLARCAEIQGVALLAEDVERVRRLAGILPQGLSVEFVRTDGPPMGKRGECVRGARLWARSCWRGGLAGLTVYDEVCAPAAMAAFMEANGVDAGVLVGADWACVDPALVDEVVRRFRQRPEGAGSHKLTFCHAPPGLGACLVERSLMRELADKAGSAGVFASIGGLLGYVPVSPQSDPITRPSCVTTPPVVRDAQFRFIPDASPRRSALLRAAAALGEAGLDVPAEELCRVICDQQRAVLSPAPQELMLELCSGRRTGGLRAVWMDGAVEAVERPVMSLVAADRLLREFASMREDTALTLGGAGDPLLHAEVFKVIALARRAGISGVHVRTDLLCDPERVDALLDCGADVISVDLMADTAEGYRLVMGTDLFERARGNLVRLLERRGQSPVGLPRTWIVPRITRCDAVYGEIESFFDRWIMGAGAAVIDTLPCALPGDRIEPLPVPAAASLRLSRERMVVLSDGRVPLSEADLAGERTVGDACREGLAAVWRKLGGRRQEFAVEPRALPPTQLHGSGSRARVAHLEAL